MEKEIRKIKLSERSNDFAYWQSRPYSERLQALETIRQEYIEWKYDTDPGFQRVCSFVKRK